MKLRLSIFVLILSTFTGASFAQEISNSKMFDIVVSAKENTFPFYSKTVPVNVKITNKSENVISTKQLGSVTIILHRESPILKNESEIAFLDIDSKYLNQGEILEFQVDLKEVSWLENPRSSSMDINPKKESKYMPVFLGKNTLSVVIGNCQKDGSADSLSKIEYRSCESNKIPLNFEFEVKED
jgi:hypothetical protein